MLNSDNVGLLFSLKGDNSDLLKKSGEAKDKVTADAKGMSEESSSAFSSIAKHIGLSEDALGKLTSGFAAAGAGMAAVGGIAVTAGVALFKLAESASEAGSEIFDASQKTGLSAESLSSLKLAADEAGSSLEQVSGSVTKFSKLIAEAADGSEEAKKKLTSLGLDPQTAINDLEGSLAKVFERIASATNPIIATKLATDAFGKSGADLIPVIKSFDGDMAGLITRAKELGVVLTDEDARAADEFGDTLDDLKKQASGVANQFALGFAPAITSAMKEISGSLSGNKNVWRDWGESIGEVILRLVRGAKVAIAVLRDLALARNGIFTAPNTIAALQQNAEGYQNDARNKQIRDTINDPNRPDFLRQQDQDIQRSASFDQKLNAADEERKTREEVARKDTAALIKLWQDYLTEVNKSFDDVFKKIEEEFKKTGNDEQFRAQLEGIIASYKEKVFEANGALLNLEKQQSEQLKKSKGEQLALSAEQADREQAITAKYVDARAEAEKRISETKKKYTEEAVKNTEAQIARQIELEKTALDARFKQLEEDYKKGIVSEKDFITTSNNIRLNALENEKTKLKELLKVTENKAEVQQKLALIEYALSNQNIENARRLLDFYGKQDDVLKGILEKYKVNLGEQKSELEALNELLGNADVTAAIEKRAAALGITADNLRHLIIVAAEAANTIQTAGDAGEGGSGPEGEPGATGLEKALGGIFGNGNADYMVGIGELLTDTMDGLAQATGNAVEAFIKFGSVGGSFRKFAAEMIAQIAKLAAIQAVWNLAEGFAKLALAFFGHPTAGPSATQHFIAAAVYGSIAGVAAIAGRAVAGDSFKKETSGGYGSSGAGGYSGGQGAQSRDAQIINIGRNAPAPAGIVLTINDRTDWFSDAFAAEVGKNSKIRQIVKDVASE